MRQFEYSLIEADNRQEFVAAVNRAINEEKWLPAGGVAVWLETRPSDEIALNNQHRTWYTQAMIRQVETPDAAAGDGRN